MSNFLDLLKQVNPVAITKGIIEAPFKNRTDQPWLQGTARNLGHAAFGDTVGNYVDQHVLGDYPGGFRHPQPVQDNSQPFAIQGGIPTQLPQQSATTQTPQPQDIANLMKLLIQTKQGGM